MQLSLHWRAEYQSMRQALQVNKPATEFESESFIKAKMLFFLAKTIDTIQERQAWQFL